jgi:hypothetical protein
MNNTHKQSKVSIREEGIDPSKTGADPVFFFQDGVYVPFEQRHWDELSGFKLKL